MIFVACTSWVWLIYKALGIVNCLCHANEIIFWFWNLRVVFAFQGFLTIRKIVLLSDWLWKNVLNLLTCGLLIHLCFLSASRYMLSNTFIYLIWYTYFFVISIWLLNVAINFVKLLLLVKMYSWLMTTWHLWLSENMIRAVWL